jgi:hypothetical protein
MAQGQAPVNHFGVMNRNDQPAAVVPDIEDDKTIDVVRVGKTGA